MDTQRQYGVEVITMADYVDRFCLKQQNTKQQNIIAQLVYAQLAWCEMFRRTMWEVLNRAIDVCNGRFRQPDDCERLLTVAVVDRYGKKHPLTYSSDINTVEMKCQKVQCSCKTCNGVDTLCAAVDSVTYTTQDVVIQGVTYQQQTWIKYDNAGNIIQDINMPRLDAATGKVLFNHEISTICKVEADGKGCIKATQPNIDILTAYIGFNPWFNGFGAALVTNNQVYRSLAPAVYNYWGYWNYNEADRSIIEIFRHDGIHCGTLHDNNGINQVIVTYQTSGETPGKEVLIPKYAENAMDSGMLYYQRKFNHRVSPNEKLALKKAWDGDLLRVSRWLNPIPMDVLAKLQTQMRRW